MKKHRIRMTVLLHVKMQDQLFTGIIDECRQFGWQVINLDYTSDYIPVGRNYAGAILDDSIGSSALGGVLELEVPIVLESDAARPELQGVPRVLVDRFAVGRAAADAFAERGFRHVGLVEFLSDEATCDLRRGLQVGVEECHGGQLHICSVAEDDEDRSATERYERQTRTISEWVRELPTPVGIFAFNHRMGARIITASEMAGFSVPEQVAVLAGNNRPAYCETAPVPLSAIDTNPELRGRELIRLLKRLGDGEPPPKHPVLIPPAGIVERRSTDILAVPNPIVASAIRYMWDHLAGPLTVNSVAAKVGVSRTSIERAFSKSLGRGVIGELRRKRLERSKELLRGTDMTVAEITTAIGLSDKGYMHRAFKETFGETPRQYRLRHRQSL